MPPRMDGPDQLQELCLYYLMNNLDVLSTSLSALRPASEESHAMFCRLFGNKMLDYYFRWNVRRESKEEYIDQLIQHERICNSIHINRRGLLTLENTKRLANNDIKHLDLTCFNQYEGGSWGRLCNILEGVELLIKQNLHTLVSIQLRQKTTERYPERLLKLLCGIDDDDTEKKPSKKKFNLKTRLCSVLPIKQASGQLVDASYLSNEDIKGCQLPNLKKFGFFHDYKSGDIAPVMIFEGLLKLIELNPQLQTLHIVSAGYYPVEQILSRTEVYSLHGLHSLVLSCTEKGNELVFTSAASENLFSSLPMLAQLRHLDVSCGLSGREGRIGHKFSDILVKIFKNSVRELKYLKSLEIAGTNLDRIIVDCSIDRDANGDDSLWCERSCEFVDWEDKFEYLGLYGCHGSHHKHIPAPMVSGSVTEEQLLVALRSYHHNTALMGHVLAAVREHVQFSMVKNPAAFLKGLLMYMESIQDWDMASADGTTDIRLIDTLIICIIYIRRHETVELSTQQKRVLLQCLMVVISNCVRDISRGYSYQLLATILKRSCLLIEWVLIHASVYSYQFTSLLQMMLRMANCRRTLCERALGVIHSMCRVSQEHKIIAGRDMKLFKILLEKIEAEVLEEVDNVYEKYWSILWTLTDTVPVNCEDFIQNRGCEIAVRCLEEHPDEASLCRKITGVMSNVSEVPSLRPLLMTDLYIGTLRKYLRYNQLADLDVSSHSASFLVLLAADGPAAWRVEDPTRDTVLQEVHDVIAQWDISWSKGVKFRTLQPMLAQLQNRETPVAQFWGAWMICNLVIVKPHAYCDMLMKENGLEIIESVLGLEGLEDDLIQLLKDIQQRTELYRISLEGVEESD